MQYAIADYLEEKEMYTSLPEFYQKKRDLFTGLMKGSRFDFIPSEGTYFQLMSYKNISHEHDVDLAKRLTKEIGVASIPVSVFYHNRTDEQILRFCFAKEDDTLKEAAEKLCRI
jgi:methionine aminotransferase